MARSELSRVSRLEGYPEGVAVGENRYRTSPHKKVSEWWIMKAAFPSRRSPAWTDVAHRLGMITYREWQRARIEENVVNDLRRVAAIMGHPDVCPSYQAYEQHGQHDPQTVMKYLGVDSWKAVPERAGMSPRKSATYPGSLQQVVDDYVRANEQAGIRPGELGLGYIRFGRTVTYRPHYVLRRILGERYQWSKFVRLCGYAPREFQRKKV